ncbi:MAG TPA: pyridoxamine 5'-phosphate oxidase, partial [Steroidobacteraceae bacterium]|nr:pyridoxamine 5'-phosphate oxidase [Steroidobacteraceae bacterium]
MVPEQSLPDTLPADPMPLVAEWLAEALRRRNQPNPNAMVLATCDTQGRPAARVVLAKEVDVESGAVRFVSNYESRKGRELENNPRAALVMHWDHLHRQVRIEGYVRRVPAADSDAYFASRARASQLGAHASAQSRPVASRDALQAQLDAVIKHYPPGTDVPRPPHWGGYVLWADVVELWLEGTARLH